MVEAGVSSLLTRCIYVTAETGRHLFYRAGSHRDRFREEDSNNLALLLSMPEVIQISPLTKVLNVPVPP